MPQLAQAQFTLTDDTDIVISIEPPENATKDMLWLAVGQNPIILYRWSGVKGELNSIPINSKNNYIITQANTDLEVQNPEVDIGIYNMIGIIKTVDLVEGQENWQLVVNGDDAAAIYQEEGASLNYLNQYANLKCTNLTKITLTLNQGSLWCPAIDTNTQTQLYETQQRLMELMQQVNSVRSATNQILLAPYQNGLQLYDYIITQHDGICFDPIYRVSNN